MDQAVFERTTLKVTTRRWRRSNEDRLIWNALRPCWPGIDCTNNIFTSRLFQKARPFLDIKLCCFLEHWFNGLVVTLAPVRWGKWRPGYCRARDKCRRCRVLSLQRSSNRPFSPRSNFYGDCSKKLDRLTNVEKYISNCEKVYFSWKSRS